VRGGNGILSRFLIVVGNDAEPSTTESAKQLSKSFADILEFRLGPGQGITLVRPDGYIAYAASSRDGNALQSIRSLLERLTN